MKKLIGLILIANLLSFSCKNIKEYSKSQRTNPQKDSEISMTVKVEAKNLSEDFSQFASKNDELIVLIYEWQDSTTLAEPLFSWSPVLDLSNMAKSEVWQANQSIMGKNLLLLLFEIDSEANAKQIDPIFRINANAILNAYNKKNYIGLKKYFNDDDLLGVEFFEKRYIGQTINLNINGIHKMDKYQYLVSIEPKSKK